MLSTTEISVKDTLVKVCRGEHKTFHRRKITYKELWLLHNQSGGNFGTGKTPEVVDWIVNISNHDIQQGHPPLNSIVVRKDSGQPGADWDGCHKSAGGPYESLAHAQAACWVYWPEKSVLIQFQS